MIRSKCKRGNNDAEAKALDAELIDCFAAQLNDLCKAEQDAYIRRVSVEVGIR